MMSEAMAEVPLSHPMRAAWEKYKETDEYANSRKWALHPEAADRQYVDGSMWAAFCAGWHDREGQEEPQPMNEFATWAYLISRSTEAALRNETEYVGKHPGWLASAVQPQYSDMVAAGTPFFYPESMKRRWLDNGSALWEHVGGMNARYLPVRCIAATLDARSAVQFLAVRLDTKGLPNADSIEPYMIAPYATETWF